MSQPTELQCKCGSTRIEVVETYSRYSKARIKDGVIEYDYEWPPNLDDGEGDYQLTCQECSADVPMPEGLEIEFEWSRP